MEDVSGGQLLVSPDLERDELPERIRKLRWIGRTAEAEELARTAFRRSGKKLVCMAEAETD